MSRIVKNNRLVFYSKKATETYWDQTWKKNHDLDFYRNYLNGELTYSDSVFKFHLPKNGKILEAGYGLGQYVVSLNALGYDVEGVDFAADTIEFINNQFPDLKVFKGNLLKLDKISNGYYQAYISLGVVEHLELGPEAFIIEAHRLLSDNGIILISVPSFNNLRKWKAKLGKYSDERIEDQEFYQYAFSDKEFIEILEKCGFKLLKTYGYDSYKGLKDELQVFNWINNRGGRLTRFLQQNINHPWISQRFGHMKMFIARKV